MPPRTWQPLEVVDKVNRKKLAAGQPVRHVKWGKYSDDLQLLQGEGINSMRRRFARDFRFLRNETQMMLAHSDLVTTELQLMEAHDKQCADESAPPRPLVGWPRPSAPLDGTP